jgi:hypothetical protein
MESGVVMVFGCAIIESAEPACAGAIIELLLASEPEPEPDELLMVWANAITASAERTAARNVIRFIQSYLLEISSLRVCGEFRQGVAPCPAFERVRTRYHETVTKG